MRVLYIAFAFLFLMLSVPVYSADVDKQCGGIQVLLPLYSYPNWWNEKAYKWKELAIARDKICVTAVINVHNGPGDGPPNADYSKGLKDLQLFDVSILGYVHTLYGKRDTHLVKRDVDLYVDNFDIGGIFFDEVANTDHYLDYYRELYGYVKKQRRSNLVVLNPGTGIGSSSVKRRRWGPDITVTYENTYTKWIASPTFASSSEPLKSARFAALIHDAPDDNAMRKSINLARFRKYRYVYVTDDKLPNPWDRLPNYWAEMIDYLKK